MINRLHAIFWRPEKDWDPVPMDHARSYMRLQWSLGVRQDLLDHLESWLGGFEGKTVLDLGGGPGQYSVAFAERGAKVTWFDISRNYEELIAQKARECGHKIRLVRGYLDEAPDRLKEQFDLVFNRICFNYGFNDRSFADRLFALVKPGGVGYVDTVISSWEREKLGFAGRVRTWLNDHWQLKIGHPYPPRGRIASLLSVKAVERLLVDYTSPGNDRVTFIRAK